ncbi:amidohydrolase family protein [Streptomyces sp. NPDC056713]|uniref:metal-dependent hydrolase family protein n=1 Tax=Streptomyces sp. NPDC056713 TaxID=3345921 RepID=UPI00368E5DA3
MNDTTPNTLIVRNGLLIDGTGATPVPDGVVHIADDRITWAGPANAAPQTPRGARAIDARGGAILPGFIDCHVHLAAPGGEMSRVQLAAMPASLRTYLTTPRLLSTLMSGVTTARDLAGLDAGFKQAVARGLVVGPRLLVAIAMMSPTGGHGDFRMPTDDGPTEPSVSRLADGTAQCAREARNLLRQGADLIKIAASGGVGSPTDQPDDEGFTEAEIRTVVEVAHAHRGKRVAAHAQGRGGILNALHAGVDSIEHGYEIDDEIIDLMLAQGTFLVPTLSTATASFDPAVTPAWTVAKKKQWQTRALAAIPRAVERGVKIAMGTDCGISAHGNNLRELGHLVDCGMSPMNAILAGTSVAAELLGLSADIGTLEAGKRADVVIASCDPLADIHKLGAAANISVVIKDGSVHKNAFEN